MYQVFVERTAEKDLERLSSSARPKIVAAIKSLGETPRPPGCRKLVGAQNDWRIRVGDYRVVYEIADAIRIVRINRIRHRKDVYRN
jgi:mRNA interferase RelE/StbE